MRDYLACLADGGLLLESVCLAALGPKMLDLAANKTAGVHPYLVTPQHTALARNSMGSSRIVAPEQGVVLETDPDTARAIARKALAQYQTYPNYINSWRRLGFSDEDIAGASDALIDALFAWGSITDLGARIEEHFTAGADHVCLTGDHGEGTRRRRGTRRCCSKLVSTRWDEWKPRQPITVMPVATVALIRLVSSYLSSLMERTS